MTRVSSEPSLADVYLDASVVVEALIPWLPHWSACDAFCKRLVADGTHIYFSQILRLEVGEAIRRLVTRQQIPPATHRRHRLDEWETNLRVRQRWMAYGIQQLETLLNTFYEVYEIPFRESLWRQSIDLIAQYGLRAHDAVHAATALQAGIHDFATNDDHFRRVSELDILVIRAT
jgi:predicted nucleic acid-binding protein